MGNRPTAPRPLSPHLTIWRWQVHAIVSIMHRITGNAMALGAAWLFLWWLLAAASGPAAYQDFRAVAFGPIGMIIAIGCTWLLFQHMASGVRHLIMDTGAGYDLVVSRRSAMLTFVFSAVATALVWGFIMFTKGL
ncbi:succinate dehydrogenase, cytochrome b556 subunit [Sandarakinorhabdus sp.]|uniref:succinate dehydrogenase, cytochrome b556 subunit n=1 Tax=Sandarakinorhabdus sp. TaxID=1916663 RepID=UPI00286E502B|nr:succinate dehydrogenase, cytochrome b556 subunit [Sandarakinorhabdus sp.]